MASLLKIDKSTAAKEEPVARRARRRKRRTEQPDLPPAVAPFTWVVRRFLQLVHVVLVIVLVYLAVWFLWTHIIQPSLTGRETVMTVVDPIVVLRSSESGVFRREGRLAHGSRVSRGQLLGTILAPTLEKQRQLLLDERAALSRSLLAFDRRSLQSESEHRDLELRLATLKAQVANVERRIADLEIRCPVDGTIQFGVGDFQEVDGHRTAIAQVWPHDSATLIEIEAPIDVITELIRRGNVQCTLSTVEGLVTIDATPLTETLQTYFQEEKEGRRKSQWASLRCRPIELPASANRPGLVGTLEY